MATWAAFLRAINVGGRRITSKDLCVPFVDMGFDDAAAFRASGNVIFSAPRGPEAKLAATIEKQLEDALGYDVAVFLRNEKQMRALAEHEPFDREGRQLHLMLLAKKPSAAVAKKILAMSTDDDRLAVGEREIYWSPRGGMQDTGLDLKAIGKLIGVNTMRTKGTIEQIAKKWFTEAS